jgi:hypothetical protein
VWCRENAGKALGQRHAISVASHPWNVAGHPWNVAETEILVVGSVALNLVQDGLMGMEVVPATG